MTTARRAAQTEEMASRLARQCVACLALFFSGCAVHHVSPANPAARLPDRSVEIAIGAMQGADVRRALGTPVHASAYWHFDLFRAATEQAEVAFAVTPWPVPFARFADQIHRYTLVELFARRPLVLIDDGAWYVEAEPGR